MKDIYDEKIISFISTNFKRASVHEREELIQIAFLKKDNLIAMKTPPSVAYKMIITDLVKSEEEVPKSFWITVLISVVLATLFGYNYQINRTVDIIILVLQIIPILLLYIAYRGISKDKDHFKKINILKTVLIYNAFIIIYRVLYLNQIVLEYYLLNYCIFILVNFSMAYIINQYTPLKYKILAIVNFLVYLLIAILANYAFNSLFSYFIPVVFYVGIIICYSFYLINTELEVIKLRKYFLIGLATYVVIGFLIALFANTIVLCIVMGIPLLIGISYYILTTKPVTFFVYKTLYYYILIGISLVALFGMRDIFNQEIHHELTLWYLFSIGILTALLTTDQNY